MVGQPNFRQFANQPIFDYSKSRHVWISDPCCTLFGFKVWSIMGLISGLTDSSSKKLSNKKETFGRRVHTNDANKNIRKTWIVDPLGVPTLVQGYQRSLGINYKLFLNENLNSGHVRYSDQRYQSWSDEKLFTNLTLFFWGLGCGSRRWCEGCSWPPLTRPRHIHRNERSGKDFLKICERCKSFCTGLSNLFTLLYFRFYLHPLASNIKPVFHINFFLS